MRDPLVDPHAISASATWLEFMRDGRFEAAWRISEQLLRRRPVPAPAALPRRLQGIWDGTPLDGRRVFIRCYHGLGDTIEFIRYAPLVRAVASCLVVWCQPSLIPLLRCMPGIDELLPLHDGTVEASYDVDVEVMELPFVFRTTLRTIPAAVPYLRVPGMRARRKGPFRVRNVGLVWRAGDWAPGRSVEFRALRPLFDVPVDWHILQAGPGIEEWEPGMGRLADANEPLATARTMLRLDLVITVDSMPAHLAGALGVPVWTLLSAEADWRWMRDRADSPWYPTMRLFRQRRRGEWGDVIARLADALRKVSQPFGEPASEAVASPPCVTLEAS